MKKILIVVNVDWFFLSHRIGIARQAILDGYQVFVACEDTGRRGDIEKHGINFIDFPFSRSGTNFIDEITTLRNFYKLYVKVKPDLVHHVTLKPVVYGSIIAKTLRIKAVVNAIAGLGYNFTGNRKGVLYFFLTSLMRFGFRRKNMAVIFQNQTDFDDLKELKIINSNNRVFFSKGSGVDLNEFSFSEAPRSGKINVLFPTRMLWDKGVKELKEASEILREKYSNLICFTLAGLADNHNKAGVTAEYLNLWSDGQYVKWVGYQKNMIEVYNNSNIVVLPSYYREGIPKSLIEACSIGRPIITTDSIGCRECVDDGVNGLKILPRDSKALSDAIEILVNDEVKREKMGNESRKKAEKEFDVKTVIAMHLKIYNTLLTSK
jgi:glycosyltransferase involved in cell wall biosynthesis